jgi:hypothetical protein
MKTENPGYQCLFIGTNNLAKYCTGKFYWININKTTHLTPYLFCMPHTHA